MCRGIRLGRHQIDPAAFLGAHEFSLGGAKREAKRRLQDLDAVLPSEQIRRALRPWLESKGLLRKTQGTRAGTRKPVDS